MAALIFNVTESTSDEGEPWNNKHAVRIFIWRRDAVTSPKKPADAPTSASRVTDHRYFNDTNGQVSF